MEVTFTTLNKIGDKPEAIASFQLEKNRANIIANFYRYKTVFHLWGTLGFKGSIML